MRAQPRRQVERHGNTWAAVGAYHSATPAFAAAYANRIATILVRWQVLPLQRRLVLEEEPRGKP